MITLLIDADIVAYKYASVTEAKFFFDGPNAPPCVATDLVQACESARAYITSMREKLGATEAIVCLSDPKDNFRKAIYPAYKSNRKGAVKPENLMLVKEWLADHYQTYQRPTLEADDCMGILATHPTLIRGDKIMVSEDKDMQTIPGRLFNPSKDTKPRVISKLAAVRYHMAQTLIGDTSDGYPGAPGIGPKSEYVAAVMKAKSQQEAWGHVLDGFRSSALRRDLGVTPEEAALVQARLSRILRASDWDFREKRPILWTPTN